MQHHYSRRYIVTVLVTVRTLVSLSPSTSTPLRYLHLSKDLYLDTYTPTQTPTQLSPPKPHPQKPNPRRHPSTPPIAPIRHAGTRTPASCNLLQSNLQPATCKPQIPAGQDRAGKGREGFIYLLSFIFTIFANTIFCDIIPFRVSTGPGLYRVLYIHIKCTYKYTYRYRSTIPYNTILE